MAARFNPFRPNNMVNPGMFVGRVDELKVISQCLMQAKNGNPQNFLVQGERGIGKSSLLFYVDSLAKGNFASLDGARYKYLVVTTDLGGCTTQFDIIRKVGRGLRHSLGEHQAGLAAAKEFWNWLTNWEVMGVKFKKEKADIDAEQIADDLVGRLTSFCKQTAGFLDGILILVDEADRAPSEAGLGETLKYLTERLAKRGCNNVIFGLAGLPHVLSRLRESHESSPRLFQTLLLEPLTPDERKRVVKVGLNQANEKNVEKTKIMEDALQFLAELSEGYPHFVQQFAFSAFDQDKDGLIDIEDVTAGAFKEGGALNQLGDKFFNEMYHARISSSDYRRVLDAMAEHGDHWVGRKDIIAESGVSEASVSNALIALKAKDIILQDEKRRGFYRLPTNSFAAWINAIRAARAKTDVDAASKFSA